MKVAILTTDNREPYRQYDNPVPWFGTAPEALLQGFAHLPDVEVHVVTCCQRPMKSSPEKLAPNIRFYSLPVAKMGWGRTFYAGCVLACRKKLREIQPDIVHGQGTERDCAVSAIYSGFPNVLTIHGNMRLVAKVDKALYWKFAAALERFAIPRSAGVVCISNYTREAVSGLARKTWVWPNAVDETFFAIKNLPERPPLILCVGFIGRRKNQNAFIRALDPLAAKLRFKVLFAGAFAPGKPASAEFFELLKTRAWCEHVGFIDRASLKTFLRRASLVALPSIEDNCPMTVLEGAAAGVPVIASAVGGVPDLVEDGKTGLLFDPYQPEQMRAATEKILTQPALAAALAAEAHRQARLRFYPEVVARKHLEIYEEVLRTASR
ncbi:MAG TPA: glycosyltransferase family 4 protein [Verrucomicrobiae bacterium]|nr:glycosyltransferase family 4 protein [Verrucomicrobiae bacterium]